MTEIKKFIKNGNEYCLGGGGSEELAYRGFLMKTENNPAYRPPNSDYAIISNYGGNGAGRFIQFSKNELKQKISTCCGSLCACNCGKYISTNGSCCIEVSFFGCVGIGKKGYADILVIGGGGGGAVYTSNSSYPGAGGAGGFLYEEGVCIVDFEYAVKVGNGGGSSGKGGTSTFGFCSAGGGGAGAENGCYGNAQRDGCPGTICGSGGGGGYSSNGSYMGRGGYGSTRGNLYGGGGGAGGNGGVGDCFRGGDGCYNNITGEGHRYAEGGNGATGTTQCGRGQCQCEIYCGKGGNGVSGDCAGQAGIVVVRYKTDGSCGILPTSTGGCKYTCGEYTIHCFTNTVGTEYFIPVLK